jgi:ABC-type nitrate/sulfonate/bicarbonate transport system substrate-binding protein
MIYLRQIVVIIATAAALLCGSVAHGEKQQQQQQVCTSSSDAKLETIRLGLEWFTNPDHLPLIVAQKHGIFKSFGLDVQLIEPSDHWEAEEEILAGRLDVAVTEPLHLAQDAARGKPVLGFSRFLHTDGGVLYDAGRGDIRRPADMCGKTISYPGR